MRSDAKMMTRIGIAVPSPAIPTSGAVIAPSMKRGKPRHAEALPAICPDPSPLK